MNWNKYNNIFDLNEIFNIKKNFVDIGDFESAAEAREREVELQKIKEENENKQILRQKKINRLLDDKTRED